MMESSKKDAEKRLPVWAFVILFANEVSEDSEECKGAVLVTSGFHS
jgi:hypothetical protein